MTRRRTRRLATALLCTAVVTTAAACTAGDDEGDPSSAPSATPSQTPSALPTATEPPAPEQRACYRLDYAAAVAPTASDDPVDCGKRHTSITIGVGTLDNVASGHLLAVDSRRVRDAVAEACPQTFARFVGGSLEDRRLSMLRPVWFTPTLEEADQGAQWYRCDAIAVAGDDQLARLTGRLSGALGTPAGRDRYAMCGTAAPDADDFERVICSAKHTWRAVATVDLPAGAYPGAATVRDRGQGPVRGRRRRRRRRPARLRVGLRVAHRRAVGGRPDLRPLLGARLTGPCGKLGIAATLFPLRARTWNTDISVPGLYRPRRGQESVREETVRAVPAASA